MKLYSHNFFQSISKTQDVKHTTLKQLKWKAKQNPSLVNKDDNSEDPNGIKNLYNLADKDFKEEKLKMFKELK